MMRFDRTRWTALGAAMAVIVGSGSLMTASATQSNGGSVFVPITPCRVMDTRPAPFTVGARTSPLGTGDTYSISVRGANGNCTIPNDAIGVSMNVTVDNPTAASYLTIYPADAPQPVASNLNWSAGQPPVANAVTSNISADGKVAFFNNAGNVNVIADIVGYYVDHNHDDRYYTKAEINARGHVISLDVISDLVSNPGAIGGFVPGSPWGVGVLMNDPALFANFTAPYNLTANTAMTLQLFYYSATAGCTVSFTPIRYSVARVGSITTAPSATAGMTSIGGDLRTTPTPALTPATASFTLDGQLGGGIRPGDIIFVQVSRGATGTCINSAITVLGAQVVYS